MPVPGPLAFRQAPSGVGGDEDYWLGPRAGGREPRWGWAVGGISSRTFLWPGLRSEPGKGRGGLQAVGREGVGTSPLSHPSPTEVVGPGTDIRGVWGTLTSRPLITLCFVSFLPLDPHPIIPFQRIDDLPRPPPRPTALLDSLAPFPFVVEGERGVNFPL